MIIDIIEKIIVGIIIAGLTALGGWLIQLIKKYKKLTKKEEDETVKKAINNSLAENLAPIKTELNDIKNDVANLQKFETNFHTRLDPVQEEIEHLKDDITEILKEQKEQGITIDNIAEKEEQLRKKLRCEWRYRIRAICLVYNKRGYMTHEEFEQLQEFYALYEAIGGNGQTKELYEKTIKLPIRAE